MPVAPPVDHPVDEERQPRQHGGAEHHRRQHREHEQRLVAGVDAEQRGRVAPHVGRHRAEQARLAGLLVGADGDVGHRHQALARLDERLERVGELRHDGQRQRRLAVVGPEARGGVGHRRVGGPPQHPAAQPLEPLLGEREVLDAHHVAVADHHVGLVPQDGRHQRRDVVGGVLVVGVGVDDDVGAQLEPGVEAGLERGGQALVVGEPDDVVDAQLARATSMVRSVEPSSMISHSTMSNPGTWRGNAPSVAGSWSSSLRHGIWMMSFMVVAHGSAGPGPAVTGPSSQRLPPGLLATSGSPDPDRLPVAHPHQVLEPRISKAWLYMRKARSR